MSFHDQPDRPSAHLPNDPQPDPEPAAPSLEEPDPGVFRHEPATTPRPGPVEKSNPA